MIYLSIHLSIYLSVYLSLKLDILKVWFISGVNVLTPYIKQNHTEYNHLTENTFKDSTNIIILLSTSQRETLWGKQKRED